MNKLQRDEILKAATEYFKGDALAADVWMNKYALRNEEQIFEKTPDDMHDRLASEFARIEAKYNNPIDKETIFSLLKDFKYIIPAGSPMSGIGNDNQVVSISNCFVIGNSESSDSYGGILKIDEEEVQLMKRRGGVGLDLSHIRPIGSPVKNSALTSTGIVPFMERYSNSTKEVAQGGRRGALMISCSVHHINIMDFIDSKLEQGKITAANISVKVTDDFMKAVHSENGLFIHTHPIDLKLDFNDIDPNYELDVTYKGKKEGTYYKVSDAKKLWDKIILNAWKSAEPGVLFWDTIINESVPDCYPEHGFKTISTNPCFPSSEYLLTENGYETFGELYRKQCLNRVITDNRISYNEDGGAESPEKWVIDGNKEGVTIREASEVFLTQKDAEILELEFKKGFKLRCTPDHHIATMRGMVEAKDIKEEDKVLIPTPELTESIIGKLPQTDDERIAYLIGMIAGDGCFSKSNNRVCIDIWGDDGDRMSNIVMKIIDELYESKGKLVNIKNRNLSKYIIIKNEKANKIRIASAWLYKLLTTEYDFNETNKQVVPNFIMSNARQDLAKYYLASLFYCDGTLGGNKKRGFSVRLAQSNKEFLQQVQLLLQANGLLFSLYKRRDAGYRKMPDGKGGLKEYFTKANYELISINYSIWNYLDIIGFNGYSNKESKVSKEQNNEYYRFNKCVVDKMISRNVVGREDVYCIKEPITKSIIVSGLSTRRCGEIPLCPYDSCRLLALNLYSYVKNPFTTQAEFDFDLFKQHTKIAQKLMDDLVDLEIEKVDKILEKIASDPEPNHIKRTEQELWENIRRMGLLGRRTGLGITAEGDMLAALGMTYASDEAIEFVTKVHEILAISAYESSVDMAIDRGKFEIYDSSKEENSGFIQRIKATHPELYDRMIKHGRRNISLLTIAPNGSVSICTQTTSGIEPAFKVSYKRRRKINHNDNKGTCVFVDSEGQTWEEYNILHQKFAIWAEVNGYDINEIINNYTEAQLEELIAKSPYNKSTANDIDWVQKVKLQGSVQKWVDHSISVTVNIPKETTVDIVSQIYKTAWETGCKGMTIYRDGSRDGVLVSNNDNKKKQNVFTETNAPKRPKKIEAGVIRFQNEKEKWIAIIGIVDGRPYEIFTGKADSLVIPPSIEKGWVVKVKNPNERTRYDFQFLDPDGYTITIEGLSRTFDKEYWNYTKLISGILRHGMPLPNVVNLISGLTFDNDNINTWKNGVIRAIKRYIKDETQITGEVCPNCGAETMVYTDGCKSCTSCGHSKCGS